MNKPWSTISGHMYEEECEFLNKLAKGKRVLEIGTHHGKSTSALAESALRVTTIDTYQGDPQIQAPSLAYTQNNLEPFNNVTLIVGYWQDQDIDYDNYNMIFYDGCHTEEGEFLANLLGWKGIVAVHDYKPKEPSMAHVVEACNEYARKTNQPLLRGAGSIVWFDQ